MLTNYHRYRIFVDGQSGPYFTEYPASQWDYAVQAAEQRGYHVQLMRQFVTDTKILETLTDSTGWWKRPNGVVLGPWEVMVSVDGRQE